jgi:hypothetical protein
MSLPRRRDIWSVPESAVSYWKWQNFCVAVLVSCEVTRAENYNIINLLKLRKKIDFFGDSINGKELMLEIKKFKSRKCFFSPIGLES